MIRCHKTLVGVIVSPFCISQTQKETRNNFEIAMSCPIANPNKTRIAVSLRLLQFSVKMATKCLDSPDMIAKLPCSGKNVGKTIFFGKIAPKCTKNTLNDCKTSTRSQNIGNTVGFPAKVAANDGKTPKRSQNRHAQAKTLEVHLFPAKSGKLKRYSTNNRALQLKSPQKTENKLKWRQKWFFDERTAVLAERAVRATFERRSSDVRATFERRSSDVERRSSDARATFERRLSDVWAQNIRICNQNPFIKAFSSRISGRNSLHGSFQDFWSKTAWKHDFSTEIIQNILQNTRKHPTCSQNCQFYTKMG